MCVCFGSWMLCIFLLRDVFESLTCWLGLCLRVACLIALISMYFSSLWKTAFYQARQLLDRFSIHWETFCLVDRSSTNSRSIEVDFCSIASRFVEILLHALFFTCFASFCYLVIHRILFHYIHAFIWIPCAPLIILDHLYVSRVKLFSFLYPLSIMTKKGRICGLFLRFYMLGGEIHAFVRGRCVSSC